MSGAGREAVITWERRWSEDYRRRSVIAREEENYT